MQFKDGIKDLVDDYEYFILDVWGVVHDGIHAYPGVVETMKYLKEKNKKVCFLSNAPRRAGKVVEVIKKYGITPDLYDFIITSGEASFFDLKKNEESGFSQFGKKYLYIGPDKDLDLLDDLNYEMVNKAKDADFALTTGFNGEDSTIEEKMPQAIDARNHNLKMTCVNPDLIVVRQNGTEMICAGALAREYEKIGGEVIYYGKPYSAVYKIVCEIFGSDIRSKALAIGDGLETDIKGANDYGIDSLLVTGGILANALEIKPNEPADPKKLAEICDHYQISPKYVTTGFKL